MISQKEHEKVLFEFKVQNKQLMQRVHELEHLLDQDSRQAVIESLYVENLRCREGIKKAIGHFNQDEHQEGMSELEIALKGDYDD